MAEDHATLGVMARFVGCYDTADGMTAASVPRRNSTESARFRHPDGLPASCISTKYREGVTVVPAGAYVSARTRIHLSSCACGYSVGG